MLPGSRRLSRRDFNVLKQTGRSHRLKGFTFISSPSAASSVSRFAVVVSVKTAPRAVTRNRLRRLIYQGVRDLPVRGDFIIIPGKSMLNLTGEQIRTLFDQALPALS